MEKDYLQMVAQIVLPAQILDYFTIVGVPCRNILIDLV